MKISFFHFDLVTLVLLFMVLLLLLLLLCYRVVINDVRVSRGELSSLELVAHLGKFTQEMSPSQPFPNSLELTKVVMGGNE